MTDRELREHLHEAWKERHEVAPRRHQEALRVHQEGWAAVARVIESGLGQIAKAIRERR